MCIINHAFIFQSQCLSKIASYPLLFPLMEVMIRKKNLVPLSLRVFDNELGMVTTKFLSMCLLSLDTAADYF